MRGTVVEPAESQIRVSRWHRYCNLYEISTWVWVTELSHKYGTHINLASVPPEEWDRFAAYGFDAVWLMGVWQRSSAGVEISNRNKGLLEDFQRALPEFKPENNVGSPYCVRNYTVDEYLGGEEGLSVARHELSNRGMNLILDFVPNHVAPDHPWVNAHPEYFILGTANDLSSDAASYLEVDKRIYACGRDPYFPAWVDVLQLNAFSPGLRQAVIKTLSEIAQQCDGVRCDMAMLMLNSIFERTWKGRAGARATSEYWDEVISATKEMYPDFLFIAETYWDLEWELQQRGFDFCYDKKLYDHLTHANAESIRLHLCADLSYQAKLLRFIENHDESRAATSFPAKKARAAALAVATLPGMRMFHEGQLEGRKIRAPVFLDRFPDEPLDEELRAFYSQLLTAVDRPLFRDGQWSLCERTGWTDNKSFENILAWTWCENGESYLIVINLSDHAAQALVSPGWKDAANGNWRLKDLLSGAVYERQASEILSRGLYVELGPWKFHFFRCERVDQHPNLEPEPHV